MVGALKFFDSILYFEQLPCDHFLNYCCLHRSDMLLLTIIELGHYPVIVLCVIR